MLMDSFEVENFRSLKHLKLEKLARVNLLVGKNNSGKTSVLEGVIALVNAGGAAGLSTIEKERQLVGENADFRYLFYKFDTKNSINLSASYRDYGTNAVFPEAAFDVIIKVNAKHSFKNSDSNFREILPATRLGLASQLITTIHIPLLDKPLVFEVNRSGNGYEVSVSKETAEIFEKGITLPTAQRHGWTEIITTNIDRSALSEKIEFLKVNKIDSSLLGIMQSIDSRIERIELGAGGQIYFDLGQSFRALLPINLMGDGIQRLLDIASAIANVAGGIVLIDEIDNGLHYSALRILWKGILQAAREYDVQVFATTHSAEALRHLTWVLDDEEYKDYRDDVAAYTLIRAEDDTIRSYRHDYEQLDYALDHGVEIRN